MWRCWGNLERSSWDNTHHKIEKSNENILCTVFWNCQEPARNGKLWVLLALCFFLPPLITTFNYFYLFIYLFLVTATVCPSNFIVGKVTAIICPTRTDFAHKIYATPWLALYTLLQCGDDLMRHFYSKHEALAILVHHGENLKLNKDLLSALHSAWAFPIRYKRI